MSSAGLVLRPAGAGDVEHVKWVLYTAVNWNPERPLPPIEVVIDHPQLAIYHRGWGRPGDLGVIAEVDGEVVGVAMCRRFDAGEEHGHGYVDPETPELAVGVLAERRGEGIGAELMTRLAAAARAAGFRQLSLSVDTANPARRLYGRLGYRELSADDSGVRMLLEL